jgi:uncharacterized protein YfaP (DUF2135 family)
VESELQSDENSLNLAEKKLSRAKQDYAEAQAKYGSGVYTATQAGYITKIHVVDGQKVGAAIEEDGEYMLPVAVTAGKHTVTVNKTVKKEFEAAEEEGE